MLVARETSPRYLHSKTLAPVKVQRITDVVLTCLLKCKAICRKNAKERRHILHNLEKQISFNVLSLFQVRRDTFHCIILRITVKRSHRPTQTRSSYTDFLLQGTGGISQLSFYALLPFHPDYKLLQGPGAIQLYTPFKSGFKEKAPQSRCFNQVNIQARRATASQLITFSFVWQIYQSSVLKFLSDAQTQSIAISIFNATSN